MQLITECLGAKMALKIIKCGSVWYKYLKASGSGIIEARLAEFNSAQVFKKA